MPANKKQQLTIWDEKARKSLAERLSRLRGANKPKWGQMNLGQMLDHLNKAMQMATGELKCTPKKGPLRYWPLRDLAIYVLPWPKGVATAPELLTAEPLPWESSRQRLIKRINATAMLPADFAFAEHPAFGPLTHKTWGFLTYRHIDHHLRQFGV